MSAASEREELAMTVHEALIGGPAAAWADLLPIQQKNYRRAADAILAAGFTRQSRAEIQAEAWHEGFCVGERSGASEWPLSPWTENPYRRGAQDA